MIPSLSSRSPGSSIVTSDSKRRANALHTFNRISHHTNIGKILGTIRLNTLEQTNGSWTRTCGSTI